MSVKAINGERARPTKGRGATANPEGRFEKLVREACDDGWNTPPADEAPALKTQVTAETSRTIISRNESPDIPYSQSINPYRGCEHGCIYCYARPSHAYWGLSPGIDFETRLFARVNAAELLRAELSQPGYRCEPIALGANTDPYQPIEKEWKITRQILQVLAEFDHPFTIVTKSALVERDLDIIAPMAKKNLVQVFVSVATLDHKVTRYMDPRAPAPARRIEAMRTLAEAQVPVGVLTAPVIPFLTDAEMENVLEAARAAGATHASYTLLRLPNELKEIFKQWLEDRFPLKAAHVMNRLKEMRAGRENDPNFGSRMRGSGEFADLLRKRFEIACKKLGLNQTRVKLDVGQFRKPAQHGQLDLF